MVKLETDIDIRKEVSCRVTNSVLKYLESEGYTCDSIVNGLPYPYTREYLIEPLNWVTYEIREKICRHAAKITGDDAIMYKVGLSTPKLNPLGGVEAVVRKLTGPKMVYRFIPRYARLLDRVFKFKTTITDNNSAIIEMRTEEPGYKPSKDSCYYAQGILAAIPTLWGLPPAEIREKKCMYKPSKGKAKDGIQYQADACVYEVQWQPLTSWFRRLLDNAASRLHFIPDPANFRELEQSIRHIDQKNVELIARNKQLAIVHELALGVDKVRTIDEALTLTVEQAREIEGIRFVLVLKQDETGEYITTPYYSKVRPQNVSRPLKAIGIDPEKLLGKKPTSNKLRLQVSKIKIAQDIIKNPRVMTVTSLAELLDGTLPHAVSNSIQSILKVKKFVLVPLMVENKLWGDILFFLTQEVPIDILEMIGTHCGLALNNIINTNNLITRNTELTARNRQLAVVREIDLGVDKVRTIDEALGLVVEEAREIDGVLFVIVQKLDESGKYVMTPYYSRIHKKYKYMVNAIKALGFNPEKELGKSPTSKKFKLPLSKLKVAQDILKNPRVMVFKSLNEMLEGVWPKILCDSIQKIMGVKKFVLVPLIIEGEYWGSMLYFLTQNVRLDILEMIGTHCSLALNRILNVNNVMARNVELTARNKQLAIVREVALGVDKVSNIDEAFSFAVEKAREIDGIRFVIVQKLDESKEYVITPYHSKFRPKYRYAINAINAMGFDIEKELGKSPTSKRLRFKFSQLKAAQDYVRNPRVMVFPTLAELLDGIWPRSLCNGIQKILGVKRLVIVPIMVEGESWGNLLFFLTQDVPVDILEMIGAHCALTVKNIGNIDALAKEAMRRRILVEQSSDGIVVLDQDGKVYEANQRFAEMLGYSLEEVRKLHVFDWEYLYPKERVVEMIRTVDEAGDHFETRHRRKDGTTYDVEISTNGATFAGQKLIFCVCRDITERKRMDEAVRESEERYRTIFESVNDIMMLIDKKGKIVDVNARIEDIGGYNREEIIGKDFRALSKIVTKKSMIVLAKNYLKRMTGKDVPAYDVEMYRKNGELRTIQINAVVVRKEGEILGDLVILRDITEIRQAEKNLQLQKDLIERILATIPNAVLLLDKSLNAVIANQTFYKLFKLKKNKVEKNNIKSLITSPDLDLAIKNLLDNKEEKTSTEFRYYVDSSEILLIVNIFAMEEGNLLLVINDVTDEHERQERLYLTDRLVSVGEMASGVAHELNNPLTSIIGLSSLISKQKVPDSVQEDLQSIFTEAQRCANIVKNLLTFARKHVSKKDSHQVAAIVADVLKLRAYEHRVNNITIEIDFPTDLPEVYVDYFAIQQVFVNIILNAEAAMIDAKGYGTLKISGKVIDSSVIISFTDNGPGISKENMRSLFNPFFTTKEVGKGTGLGLSICYGIVTSHGGKIYAKSEYGKGATFVVELPIYDGAGELN